MDTERTANINIGGEEFTLLLTTRATKEIAARYGGLEWRKGRETHEQTEHSREPIYSSRLTMLAYML